MNGLVVFCKSDGSHRQLYTVYVNGTGLTQLTSDTNDYNWARWSKDGAFILAADTSDNLWIFKQDGTLVRQLTSLVSSTNIGFWQGDWSPDGSQVVVIGTITGSGGTATADLQIVNANNSGHTAVTLTNKVSLYANSIISWSPDGAKFLFTTTPGTPLLSASTCHINGSSPADVLVADGVTVDKYVPWRWYPDSTNILVVEQPHVGSAGVLLKSDGSTTSTLHSGSDIDASSTLGAMSSDGANFAWNNTAATGLRALIGGTSVGIAGGSTVSSEGLDYKDLPGGTVSAGTPQQGWHRALS